MSTKLFDELGTPTDIPVGVPFDVLLQALVKARAEYRRHGADCTDKAYECWSEFEVLADYLPDDAQRYLEELAR